MRPCRWRTSSASPASRDRKTEAHAQPFFLDASRSARSSAATSRSLGRPPGSPEAWNVVEITRVLSVAQSIAAYAIVVDAKDDTGQRFYEAHGFIPLPSRPRRLFLLAQTAAAASKAAALK